MARPQRLGLDYFPLDSNFFFSPDIKSLKRRHGPDGICVYLFLLTQIYEGKGYYCEYNEDMTLTLADELNMKEGAVRQVVTYLTGRSLLTRIDLPGSSTRPSPVTVITSTGIQRRWQAAKCDSGRKTPIRVDKRIWLLDQEETEPFIKFTLEDDSSGKNESFSWKNSDSSGNSDINKRKVKESKGEEIYSEAISSPAAISREQKIRDEAAKKLGEAAADAFLEYIQDREKIEDRQVNPSRLKGYMTRLETLASSPEERVRIARTATANHWKGFFPVEGTKKAGRHPAGNFANFTERVYDTERLNEALLKSQYAKLDWEEQVNLIHSMEMTDDERDAIDWQTTTEDWSGKRIHYRSGRSMTVSDWQALRGAPVTAVNFTR